MSKIYKMKSKFYNEYVFVRVDIHILVEFHVSSINIRWDIFLTLSPLPTVAVGTPTPYNQYGDSSWPM